MVLEMQHAQGASCAYKIFVADSQRKRSRSGCEANTKIN